MSDWQERITHETAPAIRAEHDLRYRAAAPLILASGSWADLGCGNGIAAADALGSGRPQHAVLADLDSRAVEQAAAELELPGAARLAADLTDPQALGEIGAALLAGPPERVVTCFEVVEHLATFVPLLQWAVELAREHGCTFLLSVPNDAFFSIENPHHVSVWSEGAFEELQRLLPAERTLLRQVPLAGSALSPWHGEALTHLLEVPTGGPQAVPSHFIAAFGPRHAELAPAALAVQAELLEQRRWERQREHDLASSQRHVERQQELVAELQDALRERDVWFEEWRTYIHELERELGRPLSGVTEEASPEHGEQEPEGDPAPGGAA
jgi:SAM-dependent methyltransferase